ncbi:MAG: DUF2793 domain-containing protein [Pseudooceanicola sp.]
MTDVSPILSLPFLAPSQAQKHVTHNEALQRLDMLVQSVAIARDQTTPPAAPLAGDQFIVPTGGTGAWAGQDGALALFDGTAWRFVSPQPGWRVHVLAESRDVTWHDIGGWQDTLTGAPLDVARLGVSTTADTTNRLAVASPATLLTHAGGGHQLKLNKATAGDTASLLYQTGFSGRAEMGLAGSDAFAIKVSADGSTWISAMEVAPITGVVDFPAGLSVAGDAAYHRGNLVGPVSQFTGEPTGAAMEQGAGASGSYLRFADGTQICTHMITLAYNSVARLTATWTYAMPFVTSPVVQAMADAGDLVANTAPGPDEVGAAQIGNPSASDVTLWLYRLAGMTDFTSANTATLSVTAIGRWF